jgi:hypothetical protein
MTAKGDPKGDPVTTVMSKLPAGKGDIGAFLVSYGPAYIAVDALAASIGLPPPITTATLASGAVVGAKNVIQALLAEPQATQPPGTQPPQSKKTLEARTNAFESLLNEDLQAESEHSAPRRKLSNTCQEQRNFGRGTSLTIPTAIIKLS